MKKAKGGLKQNFIDVSKFDLKKVQTPKSRDALNKLFGCVTRTLDGVKRARRSLKQNEEIPLANKPTVNQKFWDGFIEYSKTLGIDLIGFTEVDEYFIFEEEMSNYRVKDRVLDNAIVLGMEMKKEEIDQAPDPPAGIEAMRVYADLGEATNKLAQYLRDHGFQAQAFHPFGGPVLYPPMAQKAGLGEIGNHGLLISREFGPRQRLSMIATDASPLPEVKREQLGIREYCKKCGKCVRACPSQAIFPLDEKKSYGNDKYLQSIDSDKCFPQFFSTMGCSVCVKECPFSKLGYEKVISEIQVEEK